MTAGEAYVSGLLIFFVTCFMFSKPCKACGSSHLTPLWNQILQTKALRWVCQRAHGGGTLEGLHGCWDTSKLRMPGDFCPLQGQGQQTGRGVPLCQEKPACSKSQGVLFLELNVVMLRFLTSFAYLCIPLLNPFSILPAEAEGAGWRQVTQI